MNRDTGINSILCRNIYCRTAIGPPVRSSLVCGKKCAFFSFRKYSEILITFSMYRRTVLSTGFNRDTGAADTLCQYFDSVAVLSPGDCTDSIAFVSMSCYSDSFTVIAIG